MEQKNSFYSDLNTRIITRVTIINTKLINSTGFLNSEYILYIFKVITPFKSWYIKKRYSEIKVLYDYLSSENPKLKFPVFPPKRFLSTKESTIIERKNGFEELFFFVLDNIEILKFTKLINFFRIQKTILVIYIKNCILVNENKFTYELLDIVNSSSSSNDLSQNSDDSNKDKNIEINQGKSPPKKSSIKTEGNKPKEDLKSEVDEKDNNNSSENINIIINDKLIAESFFPAFGALLTLILLTYYQVKFFCTYLWRFLKVAFLIIISPLITVTYALDKGSAHKKWLSQFISSVFIQTIHAIIYSIFIFSAAEIATRAPIVAIAFFMALSRGEKIFTYLFNIKGQD